MTPRCSATCTISFADVATSLRCAHTHRSSQHVSKTTTTINDNNDDDNDNDNDENNNKPFDAMLPLFFVRTLVKPWRLTYG